MFFTPLKGFISFPNLSYAASYAVGRFIVVPNDIFLLAVNVGLKNII